MPSCRIEGFPYVIDNAVITDYTSAPVAGITNIEFLQVVGTYDKVISCMNGNEMIDVIETENVIKIVNAHMIELFLNDQTDILTFSFDDETTVKEINKTVYMIDIEVENGTVLTALVPTITLSKEATVSPLTGVAQDFTSEVAYTVTAENGTSQVWKVNVTVAT